MSILVDPLVEYPHRPSGHDRWCHMVSDTSLDELHAFAARCWLLRTWFHHETHYDLTPSKRALAVRLGAQEVTTRELARRRVRPPGQQPTEGHLR